MEGRYALPHDWMPTGKLTLLRARRPSRSQSGARTATYRAKVQREALLELVKAVGCRDNALRRRQRRLALRGAQATSTRSPALNRPEPPGFQIFAQHLCQVADDPVRRDVIARQAAVQVGYQFKSAIRFRVGRELEP